MRGHLGLFFFAMFGARICGRLNEEQDDHELRVRTENIAKSIHVPSLSCVTADEFLSGSSSLIVS